MEGDDGSDIAELMKIFVQDNFYDEKKFPHVSGQKRYLKENQEGVRTMMGVMEKLLSEERDEGHLEGRQEGKIDMLVQLVQEEIISVKDAAARLSMSEEAFLQLLNKK